MCGAQVYHPQRTEKMLAWVLASKENLLGTLQVQLLSGTKLCFRKKPCISMQLLSWFRKPEPAWNGADPGRALPSSVQYIGFGYDFHRQGSLITLSCAAFSPMVWFGSNRLESGFLRGLPWSCQGWTSERLIWGTSLKVRIKAYGPWSSVGAPLVLGVIHPLSSPF